MTDYKHIAAEHERRRARALVTGPSPTWLIVVQAVTLAVILWLTMLPQAPQ